MQWVFRPRYTTCNYGSSKNHDSSSFRKRPPHLLLLAAQIEVLISIGGISMSRVKMSWHQLQSQRQVLLMYCNTFEKLHFTTFNLQKYVDDKSMLVVARTIFQILSHQKFSIVQQSVSSCVKMSLNFSKAIS